MTKSGTQGPNGRAKFSNFDFDHFFPRIEPFWVILSKKKIFEKILEKWLSLEACNYCKGSESQKFQKKVPNFDSNHLTFRNEPFGDFEKKIEFGDKNDNLETARKKL